MPTVTIRPDSTVSAGNWSVADANIPGQINDQNDSTSVINLAQNQSFLVELDDPGVTASSYDSGEVTIRASKTGKGSSLDFTVEVYIGTSLHYSKNLTTSSTSIVALSSSGFTFPGGFNDSDSNTLRVGISTTNGTQGQFAEVSMAINYTEATGYGQNVNTVSAANIGKINSVATANIGKVNSVD